MDIEQIQRVFDQAESEKAEEKRDVSLIEIERLEDFPKHDFPLYEGVRLESLVESIKKFGILQPLLVTKKDSQMFVILSGHNRKKAAQIAELKKLPCRIMEGLTDDEQELIVRETNLQQRSFSELTHKQKAICLSAHYELMKKQGYRSDLVSLITSNIDEIQKSGKNEKNSSDNPHNSAENGTSGGIPQKLNSRAKQAEEFGLSDETFRRYVRVAKLCNSLLDMLDTGQMKLNAAYTLSFIDDEEAQERIADYLTGTGAKLKISDAEKLRAYWEKHRSLTAQEIDIALAKEKKSEKKSGGVTIRRAILQKYMGEDIQPKEAEEIIIAALEAYFASRGGQQQ